MYNVYTESNNVFMEGENKGGFYEKQIKDVDGFIAISSTCCMWR